MQRCKKSMVAVSEKKKHNGKPCSNKQERTKNFCAKKLNDVPSNKIKYYRTVSPNKNTRIIVGCPK